MAEANEVEVTTENEVVETEQQAEPVDWKEKAVALENTVKTLQRSMTKQGYELGELRQLKPLVDKMLTSQVEKREPVDFFSNPEQSVAQSIDAHPKLQQMTNAVNELRKQTMIVEMQKAHPDFKEVVKDPGFIDWVEASKIRTNLMIQADQGYDFDAGNELLSNWKERKVIANTAKVSAEQEQINSNALKAAKVDTGSGVTGKKVYARLELMRLKTSDPDKYNALNVSQLYAEGRVR